VPPDPPRRAVWRASGPPDDNGERGLIGLFLCGSLANQFELRYSWINVNDFSKVFSPGPGTRDALLANRVSPSDCDPSSRSRFQTATRSAFQACRNSS
jgi:hypothetical protein